MIKKKKKGSRKIAKKKAELPQGQVEAVVNARALLLEAQLNEAIECLKLYIKRDQIGDLANSAIDLLARWGKLDAPKG